MPASRCGLLPENPLLLVPIANVLVQQGLLRDAEGRARDALEYLDRFDHPDSVREPEWPAVRAQLKASSLYVLGRIGVAEALAARGKRAAASSRLPLPTSPPPRN